MRAVPQPRRRLGAQGPQALLSLAGLCLCQVHPDRGAAASDGGPGGAEEAAGSGGERGPRAGPHVPGASRATGPPGPRHTRQPGPHAPAPVPPQS